MSKLPWDSAAVCRRSWTWRRELNASIKVCGVLGIAVLTLPCAVTLAGSVEDDLMMPRIQGPVRLGATQKVESTRFDGSTSFGPLNIIAELPPVLFDVIAFGDTDHDGHNEVIFYVNDDLVFKYWIMEEQGGNLYTLECEGPSLLPYTTGDLDGDGRSEIIGQRGTRIQVYESVDAASHPTQLVWSSPAMSNTVGYMTVADTDRDGRMEIIHSINGPSYLVIFENTGDNAYDIVFSAYTAHQDEGEKVVADLDGDGLIEIAFCGSSGILSIFESQGDNQWTLSTRIVTGLWNAYGVEGGVDTDGNGAPEIFVMGNPPPDGGRMTLVYEAAANDSFEIVDQIVQYDGVLGGAINALGDLDGDGRLEYAMMVTNGLQFYRSQVPGVWQQVGSLRISNPTCTSVSSSRTSTATAWMRSFGMARARCSRSATAWFSRCPSCPRKRCHTGNRVGPP